ncbi:MAG: translation initiation factor IF-2 [Candidatus Omnitrophica bacterium]|nr:translation initiation factor IF-2 [Candidatus Omnitrophota bacterium]
MLLKDLAKQLNLTEEVISTTLKTLKLRSKGDAQELSPAVIMVLKGELEDRGLIAKPEPVKKPVKKPVVKKPAVKKPAPVVPEEPEPKTETKTKKDVDPAVAKKVAAPVAKSPAPVKPIVSVEKSHKPTVTLADLSRKTEPPKKEDKPVVREPLPNELAQFERPAEEHITTADGKKVIKKFVTKIITRKKVTVAAPAFIAVQPLPKRRPARDDRSADHRKHDDKSAAPSTATPETPVIAKRDGPLTDLDIKVPVTVSELSFKLQQKANVVLKTLMGMGIFASINQNLGADIVRTICKEFGFNLIEVKSQEEQVIASHEKEKEDPSLLKHRAPVVTFMGHVDHGKTSLLDAIRKTKVVDTEHGGITQHIRAYSVTIPKGTITFLDTPGHAAFTAMRSRGAHITDIVVVVIAANEGIMPQTEEAIDHARAAGVPILIALNKIDLKDSDIDRVKKQLMEHDLSPEDWGGKTIVAPVSATTGQGIDNLLDMILLEAEMLQIKANPDKKATGIVVEAHLSPGKGALATMIVQSGTLHEGDIVVVGPYYGKVKAMFDDRQRNVKQVGPSTPVEILGLSAVPEAGERFFVVESDKVARDITSVREEKLKAERLRETSKITLEDLMIKKAAGEVRELNVILKADVQGSLGALKSALEKVPNESKEVKIRFIHVGVGDVNPSDVILAHVSKAIIIAFNVGTSATAHDEMEKTPVEVRRYTVIYDIVNDVKAALEGMLKPDTKRHFIARAEVRQVFKLSKHGIVAGCFILKGKMRNRLNVDLMRGTETAFTGKITTLKRFKDDVKEVGEGFECGIALDKFDGYQVGDIIEAFEIQEIARKL